MAEIIVDGQTWRNVVYWPNEKGWHEWETQLASRTKLAIYGYVIGDKNSKYYGSGEYQGKQHIYSPSTGKTQTIAMGYLHSSKLVEAMKELMSLVKKPIKAVTLAGQPIVIEEQ